MSERAVDAAVTAARAAFEASHAPSMSIAIAVRGEVAAEQAWGLADTVRRVPATSETAYLLASVTKPVTATAVSLLAARGSLRLRAPVSSVLGYPLPQVVSGPEPTVADLLAHRAGVGAFYRFFYADNPLRPAADFRVTAARHAVVTTRPGEHYEYSNLGYGVLDEVIGRASGQGAAEFLHEAVFGPAEMPSAWIGASYAGKAAVAAERYGADGTAYPAYDVEHRGASLGWATAGDIVRFGVAHCAGGLFAELGEIRRQHQPAVPGADVGYAWRLGAPGGELVISHSGGMGGVASFLLACPRLTIVVAVLVNQSYSPLPRHVAHGTMSRLISDATGRVIDTTPESGASGQPVPAQVAAGRWTGQAAVDERAVPIEVRVEGAAAFVGSPGSADVPARILPGHGHDLRLAAAWPAGGDGAAAIRLDLVRQASGYAGKLAVTDLSGAGLGEPGPDGGQPGRRQADYVTYPVRLTSAD